MALIPRDIVKAKVVSNISDRSAVELLKEKGRGGCQRAFARKCGGFGYVDKARPDSVTTHHQEAVETIE